MGIGCGIGTDEQSAITAYDQLAASTYGYSACSYTYVDQTPGWQPPGIGNGGAGNYPGYPNPTPSYSIGYDYSTEYNQTQNPLKFTMTNGQGCTNQFQHICLRSAHPIDYSLSRGI